MRALLACVALISCAWAPDLGAQATGCRPGTPDSTVAQRYAPIFHFAPGEQWFPVLPFFSAFDTDFRDTAAIAPLIPGGAAAAGIVPGRMGPSYLDMDSIDTTYRRYTGSHTAPKNAAIRYRVRCLDKREVKRLESGLFRDRQASRRYRLDRFRRLFDYDRGRGFLVLEYYLYYLHDTGLTGHQHDTEKVYIFVPTDPASADSFRVVVGAGHSPVTPNNILVLTDTVALGEQHTHVLVELGGHSSSPDLPPYGDIRRGWDVNWFLGQDVWGTRDVQSVAGTGFLGDYDNWKTIPRSNPYSVALAPSQEMVTPHVKSGLVSAVYTLYPDTLLRAFYISAIDSTFDTARLESLAGEIRRRQLATFNESPTVPTIHIDTATQRLLQRWTKQVYSHKTGKKGDPLVARNWPDTLGHGGDQDYKADPTDVLKTFLYSGRFELGPELTVVPFFLPAAAFTITTPSVAGLHLPGSFTLRMSYASVPGEEGSGSFLCGLTYDARSYRTFSWYLGSEYVSNRESLEDRADAADLVFSLGGTWHPFLPERKSGFKWYFSGFRLRAGLRGDWSHGALNLSRTRPELGLTMRLPTGLWF
jgi:hypothetical protein